ncbi:hypothetical protein GUJ93_ZPchr0002g23977 [Zizania palustris]|uniref:Uncharacterized protein n=1 Tax=Zizania palustris TaxID=103762 RepID=A0A8J5RH17_ZIZPA|nr:hypothetical protein GUJ93_ZPchr0002g23977 [Zizania palustris]
MVPRLSCVEEISGELQSIDRRCYGESAVRLEKGSPALLNRGDGGHLESSIEFQHQDAMHNPRRQPGTRHALPERYSRRHRRLPVPSIHHNELKVAALMDSISVEMLCSLDSPILICPSLIVGYSMISFLIGTITQAQRGTCKVTSNSKCWR